MAEGTITKNEWIEQAALTAPLEFAKNIEVAAKSQLEFAKNIEVALKAQEDLIKSAKKFSNLTKDFANVKLDKDFAKLRREEAKATQDAIKAQIALEKANQAAIQTNIKLKQAEEQKRKATLAATEAEQKAIRSLNATKKSEISLSEAQRRQKEAAQKIIEKEKRDLKKQNDLFAKLTKQRNDARDSVRNYNSIIATGGKLSDTQQKELRETTKEFKRLDKAVKNINENVNVSNESVGRYERGFKKVGLTFKNLIAGLGVAAGLREIFNVLKGSIKIFSDFTKANSELAAVLGVTTRETKELQENAKALGASTEFTASQVTKLQIAFSKLGFNQKEIKDATESTLALASATGADLERAATLAGSSIRAFGLSTTETKRVVDVLSKSTTLSALNFEKLETSIAIVAPVAKNAGQSIEETVSSLGALVDAGVDASTAGTGLRNIFLEVAKQGTTVEEAFSKINSAVDKNAVALQLFGKRGATVATILAENQNKVDGLTQSLNKASGSAIKLANERLNNLSGDVIKLNSAWEGLILSITTGNSIFSKTLRGVVQSFTSLLSVFNGTADEAKDLTNEFRKQNNEVSRLENSILPLLEKYDDLTKKTNLSKKENNDLKDVIKKLGKEVPTAVLQFDTYGNAISVSTGKVREFLQIQKDVLAIRNQDAIKAQTEELERLNKVIEITNNTLNRGTRAFTITGSAGTSYTQTVKLTSQEISNLTVLLAKSQKELLARKEILSELTGEESKAAKAAREAAEARQKEQESNKNKNKNSNNRLEDEKKALNALNQFRRKQRILQLEDELRNEEKTLKEKLDLLAEKTDLEIQNETKTTNEIIGVKKLEGDQRILIEEQTSSRIKDLQEQTSIRIKDLQEQSVRDAIDLRKKDFEERINDLKRFEEESKKSQAEQVIKISTEAAATQDPNKVKEAEEEISKIKEENQIKLFEKQINFIERTLELEQLTNEQRAFLDNELTSIKLANSQLLLNSVESTNDGLINSDQEIADRQRSLFKNTSEAIEESLGLSTGTILDFYDTIKDEQASLEEVISSSFNVISEFANASFERNIENIDAEIQKNNDFYAKKIELAQGDEQRVKGLEKERDIKNRELEKKKKKEQEKQFKVTQALRATEIIIDTAVAITKSVAASPTTGGLPFSAIAAALGAAQLAVVLSQKPPKFKDGVKNFEGGQAILGDGGVQEVITDKNDRILGLSPSKDTLYNLPKGANVYSSINEFNDSKGISDNLMKASILSSLKASNDKLNNAQLNVQFQSDYNNLSDSLSKGIKGGFKRVKFNINNNFTSSESYKDDLM